MDKIYPIKSNPGVKRDGTTFSGDYYTDAQWCRWYGGLPKKIGGYNRIIGAGSEMQRATYVVPRSPNFDIYLGSFSGLSVLTVNSDGIPVGNMISRLPVGYTPNPNNIWSFDRMFSTTDNGQVLLAHNAPNLAQIDSAVRQPVWFGELFSDAPLQDTGIYVSGGICVLHPYLFFFGDGGEVGYTPANNPTQIAQIARVASQKFITMAPTRGGNSSPAGLMWSLTSVIRVTEVGTNTVEFKYDTISDDSSIMSANSVVEYDGRFYWPGIDRFLIYTGIVQELPNSLSLQYFFENIDFANRQKVWGTKVPKWGEIWWFFPDKTRANYSGECNNAIIYNIREKTWYDTRISRASGYFDPTFSFPLWMDSEPSNEGFRLWKHETALDQNIDGNLTAIPSWFESRVISWTDNSPSGQVTNVDRSIDVERFEPDFKQKGEMFLIIKGRAYANSRDQASSTVWSQMHPPNPLGKKWSQLTSPTWSQLGEYVFTPETTMLTFREQRRLMTVKCVSATVGGDYEMGNPLLVAKIGDKRPA